MVVNSFKRKIIICFLAVYVVIAVVSSIAYYYMNKKLFEDMTLNNYKELLKQVNRNVEEHFTRMYNLAGTLTGSPYVLRYYDEGIMDPGFTAVNERTLDTINSMKSMMESIFYYDPQLEHVIFFGNKSGSYAQFGNLNSYMPENRENEIRQAHWFQKSVNDGRIQWLGVHEGFLRNGDDYYFGVGKSVKNFKNNNYYGSIYVAYKLDSVMEKITGQADKQYIDIYVIDEKGNILLSNNALMFRKTLGDIHLPERIIQEDHGVFIDRLKGKKSIVTFEKSPKSQWKVIGVANIESMYIPLNKTLVFTLLATLISCLFFYISALFLSARLARPVYEIVRVMREVGRGGLETSVKCTGGDELGYISKALNEMILQIKDLIINIREKEKTIKEAEMHALQTQINPHFMYNTLNSIKFMAMMNKQTNIINAITALVSILRNTFDYTRTFITVNEELENIKRYGSIMQIRYMNKFYMYFQVADSIMNKKVFKFILQPIVENAIIHGIAQKTGIGNVTVIGYTDDSDLYFEVIDDGVGISKEVMEKLNTHKGDKFNSVGIKNIDDRIKAYYGQEYGVKVFSQNGNGTRVVITVPYHTGEVC